MTNQTKSTTAKPPSDNVGGSTSDNTGDNSRLNTPTRQSVIDVNQDVMPIYNSRKDTHAPNKPKLLYDIVVLLAIVVDLGLILLDNILMSAIFASVANYWDWTQWATHYQLNIHPIISAVGDYFTLFLIVELLVRWAIAVGKKTYYRWFFFPFVHWYEVLGCFVLLRPLRLLRAVVIIKRLHQMGIVIIADRYHKTAQFYFHVLLEELSDRVILTALDNFKNQRQQSTTHQKLIHQTIDNNREQLQMAILSLLHQELIPKLQTQLRSTLDNTLAPAIGQAVETALINTPHFRRYIRMIPVAGTVIESQIVDIGRHIGHNVALEVHDVLLDDKLLNALTVEIAKGVANMDTTNSHLQQLVAGVVDETLAAFETQVKIQQWKHAKQLPLV